MSAERVALEGAPFPGSWRTQGACRQVPPSLFFPSRGEDVGMARAVCASCVVSKECQDYAVGVPGLKGVWAGLTESERQVLRQEVEAGTDVEAPPPPPVAAAASAGTLLAHLEQLVAHQGRWARVARYASTHSAGALASLLRRGRRSVPPGRWQFEGHVAEGGGSELWARYEGLDERGPEDEPLAG